MEPKPETLHLSAVTNTSLVVDVLYVCRSNSDLGAGSMLTGGRGWDGKMENFDIQMNQLGFRRVCSALGGQEDSWSVS